MAGKIDPIRETDEAAIGLAHELLVDAKYGSLAVNETGTGFPLASRIAACWTPETGVFFAASDLSVHSKCLKQDPKCSLMIGEPGKGDGLAYPRMTLVASTRRLANEDQDRGKFREYFLAVHPKAELYIDFADFGFYPLTVERILLNGGFGKAYHLQGDDIAAING